MNTANTLPIRYYRLKLKKYTKSDRLHEQVCKAQMHFDIGATRRLKRFKLDDLSNY